MSNVLELIAGSSIRTALWLRCSTRRCSSRASSASKKKTMDESGSTVIPYLFQVFSNVILGCTVPSFNVISPSLWKTNSSLGELFLFAEFFILG